MHVQVALGRVPSAMLDARERGRLAEAISEDLAALAGRLGLAGPPLVDLVTCESRRPIQLSAGGRTLACSAPAAEEVWETVAPPGLAGLPLASGAPSWPAAQWLEHLEDRDAAARWLRGMAVELVAGRPGCLLDHAEPGSAGARTSGIDLPDATVRLVLGGLLDLGVAVGPPEVALGHVRRSVRVGRTAGDALEAAFRLLHRDEIEVRANPRYLTALFDGDAGDGTPLRSELRGQPGIDLPPVTWLAEPALEPGLLSIQVNDVAVLRRGLNPGELLVDDTAERARRFSADARPRPHPRTRGECAVVVASEMDGTESAGAGLQTAADFAYLLVHQVVTAWVDRIVGVWTLETWLAALEPDSPDLVRAAVARFTIGDLARAARALVREGVSVADRKALLDTLLSAEGDGDLVALARRAMRAQVTQSCAQGRGLLIAHRLAPDPRRLSGPLDEAGRDEILESVGLAADRMRRLRVGMTVLTDPAIRLPLRVLLEAELPEVHVVAEPELLPDVEVVTPHDEEGDMAVRLPLLRQRVADILESAAADVEANDQDGWELTYGQVPLVVRLGLLGDRSVISVWCTTNSGLRASDELFKWIALHCGDWVFGHVEAFEDDDGVTLSFRHTLLGDFLDAGELLQALGATADAGLRVRDEVRSLFEEAGPKAT